MEIGFLVNEFPALSETFILNQITGLIERGHAVHIFAASRGRDPARHPDVDRFELLGKTRYFHQAPGPGSRRRAAAFVFSASLRSPGTALRSLNVLRFGASSLELLRAALTCKNSPDLDILHCHFGPIGVLGCHLREVGMVRAPIVTTFYGYDFRQAQSKGPDVYRSLRENSEGFIAISTGARRQLENLGFAPERIYDHPIGIEFKKYPFRWEKASPPERNTIEILTVGRLVWEKGYEYALEALERLRSNRPQSKWKYRIIGDGPLLQALKGQTIRLGLRDHVEFCGAQPADFVRAALARAHVFMLPSVAEVLPVAVMEAAASGLPIIASDVGSVADIVQDGISGELVPPGDVEALTDQLDQLLRSPERWEGMGRAGRDWVAKRFDIDVLNDRLVETYRLVRRASHLTDSGEIGAPH